MTCDEAADRARSEIPDNCVLLEDSTKQLNGGWYFMFQSEAYVRSGDVRDMLVGSGGLIVDDVTGEVFHLGSAPPLEQQIAAWEWGLKHRLYDLAILEVKTVGTAVELLEQLGLRYVIPEKDGDVVWRIARSYDEWRLRKRLRQLPCVFRNQGFGVNATKVFDQLQNVGCQWELRPVTGFVAENQLGDELPPEPANG